MPKIPRRYNHFVFGIVQSGLTCAIAAAIASLPLIEEGLFAKNWVRSWLLSWATMLPVVILAAPFIRRLVDGLTCPAEAG